MIWAQSLAAFALWIAYGLQLRRGGERLRAKLRAMSRGRRVAWGVLGFLGSALMLLGGLFAIQAAGGLQNGLLTGWAWALVAMLGCAFVHLQVVAAGAMISLVEQSEPPTPREPSETGN